MASPLSGNQNFPTKNQIPDHAILDFYNKQAYLGNQFISDPGALALADASEHPLLYILCPLTSGKSLFVNSLNLNIAGATDIVTFRAYFAPTTVTGGSTITPRNIRFASATAALASVKSGVSAVSNGTRIQTLVSNVNGLGGAAPIYIIDPGQALLITGQAAVTASVICSSIHYEL